MEYIERIISYSKEHLTNPVAVICNPKDRHKFNIEALKDIEVFEDERYEVGGFTIGNKSDLVKMLKTVVKQS